MFSVLTPSMMERYEGLKLLHSVVLSMTSWEWEVVSSPVMFDVAREERVLAVWLYALRHVRALVSLS